MEQNHTLHLENREKLELSGVSAVETFNGTTVVLRTVMGMLHLKGTDLKVNRLNVESGELSVEGQITSMIYTGGQERDKVGNRLLDRLLR